MKRGSRIISVVLIAAMWLLGSAVPARAQWDKDVMEFRGRLALQDGKYASAVEQFNVLCKVDTANYWAFFYRGVAKYNLGDNRGAQKDFDRSVRLNPVFTNGYHYRAITKSRAGEYEEALKDFNRAIELRPGFYGLYFSRGVSYFLSQQFEEAIGDFDKYIRHEPKDPSAYLNRGASFLFLGDTLKAMSDYNHAIKLDRFEAEGYVRRARLNASLSNFQEAIKDMDYAIMLDTTNTFAYFSRALMHAELKDFQSALKDLNTVLKYEPGNALTLYNRSLVSMNLGDLEGALDDLDRVLNINPDNVLAHFNRAGVLMDLGRYRSALKDYDRAIELYPDFAKAYQNRSIVENLLGMNKESKKDYQTAQKKIAEYRAGGDAFANMDGKFSSLISLDADFAKKGFDDELLQHRDIDIRLNPLARLRACEEIDNRHVAFRTKYEDKAVSSYLSGLSIPAEIAYTNTPDGTVPEIPLRGTEAEKELQQALLDVQNKQYSSALNHYNRAFEDSGNDVERALILANRAVLRAEMVDFMASIQSNVQTLTMDDQGVARTRVSDQSVHSYDYSEAVSDMQDAVKLLPGNAYMHYNLAGLYCLSSEAVRSIDEYNEALRLYPAMGEGYYNRGLVLIFLKDREKGCIDLSRAGELGVKDAYSVIKKYCKQDD